MRVLGKFTNLRGALLTMPHKVTTFGMKDNDPLPFDMSRVASTTFVGEVVMKQASTPLLAAAQAKGCPIQLGTDMLFEMIPDYLGFFGFGTATPDELRAVSPIKY